MQEDNNTRTSPQIDLLVDKAIEGNADAFGRLYDMYVDRVYRHIYYRVGNVSDAEDLTQEVFMRAWQAIGRFKKTTSPFVAWLIRISHNSVIDFYRSKKGEIFLDFDVVDNKPDSDPEHVIERQFDQQQIRGAIIELPADQQQVVMMRFIEGFSFAEIAASVGKSEGAVRVMLHRSLKNLKKILEKAK